MPVKAGERESQRQPRCSTLSEVGDGGPDPIGGQTGGGGRGVQG